MSSEDTLNFIEDYRSYRVLWDINDKKYANKQARADALQELASKYNLNIVGVKNKIKCLRSYFSKNIKNV